MEPGPCSAISLRGRRWGRHRDGRGAITAKFASTVHVIHRRDSLRASKAMQERTGIAQRGNALESSGRRRVG